MILVAFEMESESETPKSEFAQFDTHVRTVPGRRDWLLVHIKGVQLLMTRDEAQRFNGELEAALHKGRKPGE